jgi:hypothetical protein
MERLATLRRFFDEASGDLKESLERVARDLASERFSGRVAVVTTDQERRLFLINLENSSAEEWPASRSTMDEAPRFVIYVKEHTLREILMGALSPLEAMLTGCLRYAGDEIFGLAILRRLASSDDAVFEPCRETGESDGNERNCQSPRATSQSREGKRP